MRTYQETGNSVEDAKEKILRGLELKEYEVYDMKVIEEPARGFLGILKKGEARIELTVREDKGKKAEFLLKELLGRLGYGALAIESRQFPVKATGEAREPVQDSRPATPPAEDGAVAESRPRTCEGRVELHIRGKDLGGLIGRRGKRVKALEHLVNLFTNIDRQNYLKVLVDVEDYNQERRRRLQALADRAARSAMERGRPLKLKPMDVYDRKIIHEHLADHGGVTTASEGREPERCLIVTPTRRLPQQSSHRGYGRGRPPQGRGGPRGQSSYGRGPSRAPGNGQPSGYGGGRDSFAPRNDRGHGFQGRRSDYPPPAREPSRSRPGFGWGNPSAAPARMIDPDPNPGRGYIDPEEQQPRPARVDNDRQEDRPRRDRGPRRPRRPAPDWETQQPPRPPSRHSED